MFRFKTLSLVYSFSTSLVHAASVCPLLGPNFPAPTDLSSSSTISSAGNNLTQLLQGALASGTTQFGPISNTTSFSLDVFSTSDVDSIYTYYYSAPTLVSPGVTTVDGDTIYRIGSGSKLFTMYLFLLEASDTNFDDPITKYVPELLELSEKQNASNDPEDFVDWKEVTIGELASHTSGIARDYGSLAETILLESYPDYDALTQYGLPPLNNSELPLCGINPADLLCDRAAFFKGFGSKDPIYAPSTGAVYSNAAFQILSYALETITGKNFSQMLEDDVLKPLNLSRTSYDAPINSSQGAIPYDATVSLFNLATGDEAPAGGMYSSSNDLAKFGRAILASKQLSKYLTLRWMKPRAFTSDPTMSVGAPWEIRRVQQDLNMVDIYTKSGILGLYSSMIALIPQYNTGFSLVVAGQEGSNTVSKVLDLVSQVFLPAFEDAGREQANAAFAGTYKSSTINSSLVIQTDPSQPGLSVTEWVSNGTDFITFLGGSVSLFPTGLANPSTKTVSFRAVINSPLLPDTGIFEINCPSWFNVESQQYGTISVDDFRFTLGSDGNAVSVQPRALRISLDKA